MRRGVVRGEELNEPLDLEPRVGGGLETSPRARGGTPTAPSDHAMRLSPRCGRWSVSEVWSSSSSGTQRITSMRVRHEHESAAGPQQPVRLGHPGVRIAPDARAVLGDREVEARVRQRHALCVCLAIRGNSMPVSRWSRRAVSSCAGVTSIPTGRAPRRASHEEKYAVPHPSSTTSRPATSPRTPSSLSEPPNIAPRDVLGPPCPVRRGRPCTRRSTSSSSRDCRDVLGLRQDRRGRTARARVARSPSSPSRARCSRRARARSRPESSPERSRAGSSRPSSCGRPRSPTRRSRPGRAPAPDVMKSTSEPKNGLPLCSA